MTICACRDCKCEVSEGKAYCGEACEKGHPDGKGCGHGCGCSG